MHIRHLALACCASVALAYPAHAAPVVVGGYTLDTGTFGAPTGVHFSGTQTGTTLNAFVNTDGSAVTFSSTDMLTNTGSGEAILQPVSGYIVDLDVLFEKAWDNITFAFTGDSGTFSLLVNGTSLFTGPGCDICTIGNGENKFTISGTGITSLAYTFDPGIDTAKQFRVEGVSAAVPEPATWAMMLLGFGAVGFAMRRRRGQGEARIRFA
jgi:hypothetical protein